MRNRVVVRNIVEWLGNVAKAEDILVPPGDRYLEQLIRVARIEITQRVVERNVMFAAIVTREVIHLQSFNFNLDFHCHDVEVGDTKAVDCLAERLACEVVIAVIAQTRQRVGFGVTPGIEHCRITK